MRLRGSCAPAHADTCPDYRDTDRSFYTADGGTLTAARCEDIGGNTIFRCWIENGLVMEKNFTDSYAEYTCRYEYDENRNPVRTVVYYDGEETPGELFYFVEVEVEADRASYLLEQQTYLLAII